MEKRFSRIFSASKIDRRNLNESSSGVYADRSVKFLIPARSKRSSKCLSIRFNEGKYEDVNESNDMNGLSNRILVVNNI